MTVLLLNQVMASLEEQAMDNGEDQRVGPPNTIDQQGPGITSHNTNDPQAPDSSEMGSGQGDGQLQISTRSGPDHGGNNIASAVTPASNASQYDNGTPASDHEDHTDGVNSSSFGLRPIYSLNAFLAAVPIGLPLSSAYLRASGPNIQHV